MNIKKNNLLARYYRWIYGNLPIDLCSFFWGSVFAILLFFLLVPGRLFTSRYDDVYYKGFVGSLCWVGYISAVVIGNGLVGEFGYQFINLWGILLLGPLMVVVLIAVGGFAIFGGIGGTIYILKEKVPNTSLAQNTKNWVGAIRGKYCTKITWK